MRMKERKIEPNRITYNILMRACLERPGSEGWTRAFDWHTLMEAKGIKASKDTWYLLLKGVAERRLRGEGTKVLRSMRASGFYAEGALTSLVKKVQRMELVYN